MAHFSPLPMEPPPMTPVGQLAYQRGHGLCHASGRKDIGVRRKSAWQWQGRLRPWKPIELIGTYPTRAEARRKQQQLESTAGFERRLFTIRDRLDRIVL